MINDADNTKWIAGIFIAFSGAVMTAFYRVRVQISNGNKTLHTKVDTNIKDLHNKVDAIKDNYVRRDDFKAHMDRQELASGRIEAQVDKINDKIDRLVK